jgi:hypothetical protein
MKNLTTTNSQQTNQPTKTRRTKTRPKAVGIVRFGANSSNVEAYIRTFELDIIAYASTLELFALNYALGYAHSLRRYNEGGGIHISHHVHTYTRKYMYMYMSCNGKKHVYRSAEDLRRLGGPLRRGGQIIRAVCL